jgi:hypothetical protein
MLREPFRAASMPVALGNIVWFSIVRALPANVAAPSSVMVPVVAMACRAGELLLALTKPGQMVKTAT